MYVGRKEIKLLVDEIKGDELMIRQILEKYHIGERDYDKILDKIEKIERNTIRLVNTKREYDEYNRTIDNKSGKRRLQIQRERRANDQTA